MYDELIPSVIANRKIIVKVMIEHYQDDLPKAAIRGVL